MFRVPLSKDEEDELQTLEERRAFANKEVAEDLGENLETLFEEEGKMYKKRIVHKHWKTSKKFE